MVHINIKKKEKKVCVLLWHTTMKLMTIALLQYVKTDILLHCNTLTKLNSRVYTYVYKMQKNYSIHIQYEHCILCLSILPRIEV